MKPLRDQSGSLTGDQARLADLFAAVEPYRTDPLRKRRIHVQIIASMRTRRRLRWQPALAAAALLVAGTAAAALGHRLLAGETAMSPQQAPLAVAPTTRAPTKPKRSQFASLPKAEEATPDAPDVSSATLAPEQPAVPKRPVVAPRPRPIVAHGEDPTRVAEALRALRKEGDARRAQTLLQQYLRQNPKGALSEEALALAIEAAHARRDPKAAHYARRYLARYPAGRHRALARRVLSK